MAACLRTLQAADQRHPALHEKPKTPQIHTELQNSFILIGLNYLTLLSSVLEAEALLSLR